MPELTPIPGATPRHDDDGREIVDVVTCGTCGCSWNDAAISSLTPAPSGRCPFEYEHEPERPAEGERETFSRALPMRWPLGGGCTLDIDVCQEHRVWWRFKTTADYDAFWALPEAERDELRRGFDASVAGMLERAR